MTGSYDSFDRMYPDLKKLQSTALIDKQQLQSFFRMLTNMGNFIPHLRGYLGKYIATAEQCIRMPNQVV